jgi:DNA-binding response OmpR family regulator
MNPAGKHILIIDNDPTSRRLFGSLLGIAGYEVLYAEDGRVGREVARRLHPDLILLDINMSGESGFKTAVNIHKEADSPASDIPMVFLSNADLPIEEQKWMSGSGVIDYIQKGVTNDEFVARVNGIFEKLEKKVEVEMAKQ